MSQAFEVEVKKDTSNDEVLQWVTFQLEEETYGINGKFVKFFVTLKLLQFQVRQITY